MAGGIPSRRSNPFATCWLGPLGTPYIAANGNTPAVLTSRLATTGWRGQIVGPHGAGKSTLLRALEPEVNKLGRPWVEIGFRQIAGRPPAWQLIPASLDAGKLLVVDGYEQLTLLERWVVQWRCWRASAGLLITTHRPFNLPTLLQFVPNEATAMAVFEQITGDADTPVTRGDVLHAFNASNRDMRQMFDKLYDLHEQRNRTEDVANKRHSYRVTNCEQAAI